MCYVDVDFLGVNVVSSDMFDCEQSYLANVIHSTASLCFLLIMRKCHPPHIVFLMPLRICMPPVTPWLSTCVSSQVDILLCPAFHLKMSAFRLNSSTVLVAAPELFNGWEIVYDFRVWLSS